MIFASHHIMGRVAKSVEEGSLLPSSGPPGVHIGFVPVMTGESSECELKTLTPLYFPNSFCSFLTGLGCPNCIDYFTSQGLQNIYHLQNLTIEVNALGSSVLTTYFYWQLISKAGTRNAFEGKDTEVH